MSFDKIPIDTWSNFDCNNEDLNDFFKNDARVFAEGLMCKTCAFVLGDKPDEIVCTFAVSNDSIKASHLPNARKKKVAKQVGRVKVMRSYPAVMVGRLAVNASYARSGVGRQLMDFIKYWFSYVGNKTGCRYVIVDAYKNEIAIPYYQRNGFDFVFSSEEQEREYLNDSRELNTRLMYFDLITLKVE